MTYRYEIDFSDDPIFETVTGLTNTTFNINNITENRMATEGQLLYIAERINDLQNRINYCCNDIATWKTYVRIIAEGTHTVVSDWDQNVVVGTTRKNNPFTVYFGVPFNTTKFYPNASIYKENGTTYEKTPMHVKINLTGKASLCESALISNAMNMDIDDANGFTPEGRYRVAFGYAYGNRITTTSANSAFPTHSNVAQGGLNTELTVRIPNVGTIIADEVENNPFPIISPDSKYRIYLDGATVKVDVITKSHFAENDYIASFFIQYVLREGMSL